MALTRTPTSIVLSTGNITWTNMPAASTELLGVVHRRTRFSFIDVDKIRLVVRVSTVGQAGATLSAQYSTDESAWSALTTNTIPIDSTGTKVTAFEALPAGAKGDVFVRIVGVGGNAALDPVFGNISLECR